jgi:integrase
VEATIKVRARRDRGDGGLYLLKTSPIWYTKIKGRRQSTGTHIKEQAKAILAARMGRAALGLADPEQLRALKYEQGRELVLSDYRNAEKASLVTKADGTQTVWGLDHLDHFFAGRAVVDIKSDTLNRFVEERQRDGAAPGTINRNLALLRRMLNLLKREHDFNPPHFPRLKEPTARQGFCEPEQFAKLYRELPPRLRTFALFTYTTGCRTGEAKKLRWNQIDWSERIVRVEAEQTKNAVARTIPLSDEIFNALKKTPEDKRVGLLFPVGCFRKAWQSACVRAGLGVLTPGPSNGGYGTYQGLNPHDFRRSAVRNLRKAGVGEVVAMSVSGHKTAAVFQRYNIVSSEDKSEAVRLIGSSLGQVLKQARGRK